MKRLRSLLVPALCVLAMAIGLCTAASAHPGLRARAAALADRLTARADRTRPEAPVHAALIASAVSSGAAAGAAQHRTR